jgi:uncharacterized membrane-anchored protein YitT (DUF2179 family)
MSTIRWTVYSWWHERLVTPKRWPFVRDYLLITVGASLLALSMHLFFIPSRLVAGGLSGAAQLVNSFTGWPIGTLVLLGNIPLFFLGWRWLGGRRFLARTVFASLVYSVVVDGLALLWPDARLTEDLLLNALYGGVMAGVGAGLVFRAQATSGGTDILARTLEKQYGIPLSRGYLYTDGLIVFLAALAFSWEHALYAVVGLYIGGVVTEVTLTGTNVMRVATIITSQPEAVAARLMVDLERGVTEWTARGMYSGQDRHVLMCAVSRSEMVTLKAIVHDLDPQAFVIIGQAQEVFGEGFRRLEDAMA